MKKLELWTMDPESGFRIAPDRSLIYWHETILNFFYLIVYLFLSLNSIPSFMSVSLLDLEFSQPAITCSKLTIETLEQGVKYVQS